MQRFMGLSWHFRLATFITANSFLLSVGQSVLSQIVPDSTLPTNSTVTPQGEINGGTTAGANLFHSFSQFSIPTNGQAWFNNALNIQNIISRVTGSSISSIDGLIGANGSANLFLINPNGIILGPNAQLNIGGSFVGSTANAIQFGDQGFFSATNPTATSLLTVNPSALVFNQTQSQRPEIRVQGDLAVKDSKSLLLVGGDVNLDSSSLTAPGGRVELGGLAGSGSVGLNGQDNTLSLGFPVDVQRADVSLTQGSEVNVQAGGGGSIVITAHNLDILGRSSLKAGILSSAGSVDSQAGDITLNVAETMVVNGDSQVTNSVSPGATGKGGSINITAGSLFATDGGLVNTSTYGQGNAGNITINVRDTISFNEIRSDDQRPSGVSSSVDSNEAVGNGGNIEIIAGSLFVTKGAGLVALTRGQGDAGSITINARDTVSFDGKGSNGFSSVASSAVEEGAMGKGGNINVTARSLSVTDAGLLNTSTNGRGNSGSINIDVRDNVSFSGEGQALAIVQEKGIGNGGNINIQVSEGSLSLKSGAGLSARTEGKGNAGSISIDTRDTVSFDGVGFNGFSTAASSTVESGAEGDGGSIDIQTRELYLTNGASLLANTFAKGNAGNITIKARNIVFDGVGSNEEFSGASSSVAVGAEGDSGSIDIQAESLSLTDGARLSTSTQGEGNAGSINITADTVSFDGVDLENDFSSSARSTVGSGGVGNGGSIHIHTGSLSLTKGAILTVGTVGIGNAGSINITARDIVFDGVGSDGTLSGARSAVGSTAIGNGGSINIKTGTLSLSNSGIVRANTAGKGNAGSIQITANTFDVINGGRVLTTTTSAGNAGSITLDVANDIILTGSNSGLFASTDTGSTGNGGSIRVLRSQSLNINNGAAISVSSQGQGDAGDITVDTDTLTLGIDGSISGEMGTQATGDGSSISISANNLTATSGGNITTTTSSSRGGEAGSIILTIANNLDLSGAGSGLFAETQSGSTGKGGNINLTTGTFSIADGAQVSATTRSTGDAGSIQITANTFNATNGGQVATTTEGAGNAGSITLGIANDITLTGINSGLFASTDTGSTGSGGSITVNSSSLDINDSAEISASSQGQGDAGNITVDTGTLTLGTDGSISGVMGTQATGDGSSISITASDLVSITDGAAIAVDSRGSGNGGSITLAANSLILDNGRISAATTSSNGGNVNLRVNDLTLLNNNSQISAEAGELGNGGNLTIDTRFLIANNNSDITANALQGTGGQIQITAEGIFQSADSDITASSELGIDGTVQLNTLDVDPRQGLIALPETVVDASRLVSQRCATTRDLAQNQSEFIVAGRGGIPPSPTQPLQDDSALAEWITLKPNGAQARSLSVPAAVTSIPEPEEVIVEAQGWVVNDRGKIVLTAPTSLAQPARLDPPNVCQGS
jgi:filamentous hemagglutinin family protein